MDGTDLHAVPGPDESPYPDNVVRKEKWLAGHPGDVIRLAENHRWGFWYECVRDGRVLVEANDLGVLMTRLEVDFR